MTYNDLICGGWFEQRRFKTDLTLASWIAELSFIKDLQFDELIMLWPLWSLLKFVSLLESSLCENVPILDKRFPASIIVPFKFVQAIPVQMRFWNVVKNDIPFFLFQNVVVVFKYAIRFLLICWSNRWSYGNVFGIWVKFNYGFLDIHQFLVYKIFCFIWSLVPIWMMILSSSFTAQKMKFYIKDFFSKCDQIRWKLRIWSHSLKKSLLENFIFCAVFLKIRNPFTSGEFSFSHPANIQFTTISVVPFFLCSEFRTVIFSFASCFEALLHFSDSSLSSSILDGINLLLVLFSELFAFTLFMLLFVVVVDALFGVKSLLESFTALLFVFLLSVLLFVAVVVVLDCIKMLLVSFTVLLFVFALFLPLVVVVVVVALTAVCEGKSSSS